MAIEWQVIGETIVGASDTTLHDVHGVTVVSTHTMEDEAARAALQLIQAGGYDRVDIEQVTS